MGRLSNDIKTQIYELLGEGLSVKEVSKRLKVSEKSVQKLWDELEVSEEKKEVAKVNHWTPFVGVLPDSEFINLMKAIVPRLISEIQKELGAA